METIWDAHLVQTFPTSVRSIYKNMQIDIHKFIEMNVDRIFTDSNQSGASYLLSTLSQIKSRIQISNQ